MRFFDKDKQVMSDFDSTCSIFDSPNQLYLPENQGTRGWPGPRSCRSSSLEVLCSCQEVASTGASRQATVGAGGCAHQCQAPAAHRHRHRHRSAAPSLLARTAPPRASARLFLARVARSQPSCLCRLIPSSPVCGSPGFPSSVFLALY